MSLKKTVGADYQSLSDWLSQVPRLFSDNQGTLLYDGRNQIRCFEVQGVQLVVKRYKRHGLVKRLVYTFFRTNKAQRSYENAMLLRKRGFATPQEVAYLEEIVAGVIRQVYYVCLHTSAAPIRPRLIEQDPFDEPLATAYARFVACLHDAGVLHRDLNPTNVLYQEHDGRYDFEMIDINRMRFYDGPVPKAECMENLTLFYWLTPAYRFILREYAAQRGWSETDIDEAIRVKHRHDRHWVRRKRITHPFRKS
jgi:serine/threonine protein kinase